MKKLPYDRTAVNKKKLLIVSSVFICILAVSLIVIDNIRSNENHPVKQSLQAGNVTTAPNSTHSETKENENDTEASRNTAKTPINNSTTDWPVLLSSTQASSLTAVVNKKHKLSNEYVPPLVNITGGQVRKEVVENLFSLLQDAKLAGATMKILSTYRSYSTQISVYQKWVNLYGKVEADRVSARPGHSEHQTGLAIDLGAANGSCDLETCFEDTQAGKWLAINAPNYGFIIRYPKGKEDATGYSYEPWHLRYVGLEFASKISRSGQTMDQYFGVEAGGY